MVLNAKPLPLAKPVNMPSGITAEIFGDVAMIADFVYTFRDLLVPRETLYISIGKQRSTIELCNACVFLIQMNFLLTSFFADEFHLVCLFL